MDKARTAALAAAQYIGSTFVDSLRRVRFNLGPNTPSSNTSFSIAVPAALQSRKIYACIDAWTTQDANTYYWWLKSTVSVLRAGMVVQQWPLEVGFLGNAITGFEEYLRTAFNVNANHPGAIRLDWAIRTSHREVQAVYLAPVEVNVECDTIRWDFIRTNPPIVSTQLVSQARVYLACISSL